MLTAKDIRDVQFSKSMGGYRTTEVDTFLDQCAETLEEMTKQAEENAKKMQVLAETVVGYRGQEDSIRTALISAQQLSEQIKTEAKEKAGDTVTEAEEKANTVVAEAEEKANTLITEAETKANAILTEIQEKADSMEKELTSKIADEQKEYERIQKEVVLFRSKLMSIYREHLTNVGILPESAGVPEEIQKSAEAEAVSKAAEVETVEEPDEVAEEAISSEESAKEDDYYDIELPAVEEKAEAETENPTFDFSAYKLDEE